MVKNTVIKLSDKSSTHMHTYARMRAHAHKWNGRACLAQYVYWEASGVRKGGGCNIKTTDKHKPAHRTLSSYYLKHPITLHYSMGDTYHRHDISQLLLFKLQIENSQFYIWGRFRHSKARDVFSTKIRFCTFQMNILHGQGLLCMYFLQAKRLHLVFEYLKWNTMKCFCKGRQFHLIW